MPLKVMTLNIHYDGDRPGPWAARRSLIAEVLERERPHLVALQAVCADPSREGGRDQARQLAELAGGFEQVHFEPASGSDEGRREGQAILSRLPVRAVERVDLGRQEGHEDGSARALLHAMLEVDGEVWHLVNAHFSWVEEQTLQNVEETLQKILSLPGPLLLAGDLNAEPESRAMRRLAQAGLVDAWQALRPGDPGPTFESFAPVKRIDYCWAAGGLERRLAGIERVAGERGADGSFASDHLGLLLALH